jgi:hypothetical protein
MRTLSEALGSHGGAIEFVDKHNKKIFVSPLTLKLMSKYEKWLESKAIQNCMELKNLDPKLFREAFSAVNNSIMKGEYAFGGEIAQESLQTPSGVGKLVSLMANVSEEEAMNLVTEEGDKFRLVLDLAIKQSMPQNEENSEGNEQTAQPNT